MDSAAIEGDATSKEPRKPSCTPASSYIDATDVLQKIKKERQRELFVLATNEIDDDVYDEMYQWRAELKNAGKAGLDVLLHSPGGDLTACYAAARLLARSSDSWEALVPSLAASGATLICLGSCNVVMALNGRMSPLDPQVISKRQKRFFHRERQSPLEAFEAVRYLRYYTVESLDAVMHFLLQHQGVEPHLALETARKISASLVSPILGRVEPFDLGTFRLDSRMAIEYCTRIVKPSDSAKKTQRQVDPRALVEEYPAHEFLVDFEEAKALGFAIEEPTNAIDRLFDTIRPRLAELESYIGLVP
jgi:Serine dehydrogenase proteinase